MWYVINVFRIRRTGCYFKVDDTEYSVLAGGERDGNDDQVLSFVHPVIQLTQLRWCHAHDIYIVDYPTMNMPLLPPQAITGLIRKLQGA